MTKPLRPEEIAARKLEQLDEGVIDTFNDLITAHFDGTSSKFSQEDVIDGLLSRGVIAYREDAFGRHLLDVEHIYRAHGWRVVYEKPGFNEHGDAFFTFMQAL
jgi:hypothetical protein